MTEKSHYNPLVKQQILKQLKLEIYSPIVNSINTEFYNINLKNSQLNKSVRLDFIYKGKYYLNNNIVNLDDTNDFSLLKTVDTLILNPHLHSQFDDLLLRSNHLMNTEIPLVMGYVVQVLNISNNPHNYLSLLPDNLHKSIRLIVPFSEDKEQTLGDRINKLKINNKVYLDMLKQRLMSNLLLV